MPEDSDLISAGGTMAECAAAAPIESPTKPTTTLDCSSRDLSAQLDHHDSRKPDDNEQDDDTDEEVIQEEEVDEKQDDVLVNCSPLTTTASPQSVVGDSVGQVNLSDNYCAKEEEKEEEEEEEEKEVIPIAKMEPSAKEVLCNTNLRNGYVKSANKSISNAKVISPSQENSNVVVESTPHLPNGHVDNLEKVFTSSSSSSTEQNGQTEKGKVFVNRFCLLFSR